MRTLETQVRALGTPEVGMLESSEMMAPETPKAGVSKTLGMALWMPGTLEV